MGELKEDWELKETESVLHFIFYVITYELLELLTPIDNVILTKGQKTVERHQSHFPVIAFMARLFLEVYGVVSQRNVLLEVAGRWGSAVGGSPIPTSQLVRAWANCPSPACHLRWHHTVTLPKDSSGQSMGESTCFSLCLLFIS